MVYNLPMFEIIKTETFERWLLGLKDRIARVRIQARIDRMVAGNPGDTKLLREGISEMRIDVGPGYRVYFMRRGPLIIVLLAGGGHRAGNPDIHGMEGVKHGRKIFSLGQCGLSQDGRRHRCVF